MGVFELSEWWAQHPYGVGYIFGEITRIRTRRELSAEKAAARE